MPVRRLLALLSPFALLVLPACGVMPVRPHPAEQPPPTVKHTSGQFASIGLPKAPGDRIIINAAVPEPPPPVVPMTPLPTTDPEALPGVPLLDPTSPLVKAVQAFHDGQPEMAVQHLNGFDKPNQELLLQLIPALVQASKVNLSRADGEEPQVLARQFESAAATLAKRAGLGIPKAAICLGVDGYGLFTPVKDKSALMKNTLYQLYVEIGNVPCVPGVRTQDGAEGYFTKFECEMQVKDEFGQVVEIVDVNTGVPAAKSKASKNEFRRSPVRDYFVEARLNTPARPGAYTVTFEVRDPRTGQSVSRTVPFRVQ